MRDCRHSPARPPAPHCTRSPAAPPLSVSPLDADILGSLPPGTAVVAGFPPSERDALPEVCVVTSRAGRRHALACLWLGAVAACGGGGGTEPSAKAVLDVDITGLPGGANARVTLTAPDGSTQALTGTTHLTDLPAGAYEVRARYVLAQGQTWTPAVAVDTAILAARDTGLLQVTYAGGSAPTANVSVAGYTVVQSIQRTDNAVPMVADRAAVLRIFPTATAAGLPAPKVRVRLYAASTLVDSIDVAPGVATVPTTVDTAQLTHSWNALLPAARVVQGLSFAVVVDPDDDTPESDKTDNTWPASGTTAVAVQPVAPLLFRFVPVKQSVNNLTGAVSNANADSLFSFTQRLLPLGAVSMNVRGAYTTNAPAFVSNDSNGAWSQTLGEIQALRTNEGGTRHYVGILQVTYGGGIAGLGYVGLPASIAWDKPNSAPSVIAHELGHNFGRLHAPCGNPGGVDGSYPPSYSTPSFQASIGAWGLDMGTMLLKSPGIYHDVMGYCDPDWISDYNYNAILSYRGSSPAVAARTSAPGLLVWGRVRNGSVILEPGLVVDAPARMPAAPGPHQVEGVDAAGNRLFSFSFAGDLVPDLPQGDEYHFAYVVPLSAGERARLAGLRLVGKGLTARQAAIRAPGQPLPAAAISATATAGGTEVRWNPAYPMAIIRDAATGEVLSFARGGAVRLPATGRALRVEPSTGVVTLPAVTIPAP